MQKIHLLVGLIVILFALTTHAAFLKPTVYVHAKSGFGASTYPFAYKGKGLYKVVVPLEKGSLDILIATKDKACQYSLKDAEKLIFNKALTMKVCSEGAIRMHTYKTADYEFTFDNNDAENPAISVVLKPGQSKRKRTPPPVACLQWDGQAVTVDVSSVFADGDQVRDFYSGQTTEVIDGKLSVLPTQNSHGLLLLESTGHQPSGFSWENATVYFIMTDRFYNGNPLNDNSYGRKKDGKDNIGTFHGGDFAGITQKLDYLAQLGINALWITPVVEQIHGFVGGSPTGKYPFYGYHGYWALDFTKIDNNWGTEQELQTLVDEAHRRGIRVILDIVVNHVGYHNLADMQTYHFGKVYPDKIPPRWTDWVPGNGLNWHSYHQYIDYLDKSAWLRWWGPDWVRAGLPGYQKPGGDDLTMALAGLPDLLTESKKPVRLPPLLKNKADTHAVSLADSTVVDYLVKWQVDWVRKFGFDGFRGDTAKHVEYEVWDRLKTAAQQALDEWRAANPEKVVGNEPFWMVGEVWDQPVFKNAYYDHGFNSLVNFEFQKQDAIRTAQCLAQADEIFQSYADSINTDPEFNALTYISSHDTKLFFADFEDYDLQRGIAAPLLLMPGGVQIFYGDEIGRKVGPYADDPHQGTRSDMPWRELKEQKLRLLAHWQKLGNFRKRHLAVGAGRHTRLSDNPYAFSRVKGEDKVVVVYAGQHLAGQHLAGQPLAGSDD
jgi:alpha-amylase